MCADDNASQAVKAQFPLREAQIEVSEVPGKPGAYRAVAFLRPHFQLDELSVSLRLVADLPASARSDFEVMTKHRVAQARIDGSGTTVNHKTEEVAWRLLIIS